MTSLNDVHGILEGILGMTSWKMQSGWLDGSDGIGFDETYMIFDDCHLDAIVAGSLPAELSEIQRAALVKYHAALQLLDSFYGQESSTMTPHQIITSPEMVNIRALGKETLTYFPKEWAELLETWPNYKKYDDVYPDK